MIPRLAMVGALWGSLLVACADQSQTAMCPAYQEFEAVYDEVAAADPTGATANQAAEAVGRASGELRQLRAVADERYTAPIDELQSLLADLERTLNSVDDEADYAIWEPLVDDTLDEVVRGNARLRRAIGPACQGQSDQALGATADGSGNQADNGGELSPLGGEDWQWKVY